MGCAGAAFAPVLKRHPALILFIHDGSLMVQPFDAGRLELEGERTVIVPEVRYQRRHDRGFSVSGNGLLLYRRGTPAAGPLASFGRNGQTPETVGARNDTCPSACRPTSTMRRSARSITPVPQERAEW
jgi:hypothetical protein